MTYPLANCNGYLVVEIDGETYMLDTGADCSVPAQSGKRSVRVEGIDFPLTYRGNLSAPLRKATGRSLAGILGPEVLRRFGGVTCDFAGSTITFGAPTRKDGIAVSFDRSDYRFRVSVNGREVRGFMDTGAPKAVIGDRSLVTASCYEGRVDEPTLNGSMLSDQYGGELTFGGVTGQATILRPVDDRIAAEFACRQIDAFFSVATLTKEYFAIDVVNRLIRFR